MTKYVDPKLIKQELDKIRKSKHFGYQRVKDRAIKNPTTFARHKDIQKKRKQLSNDRFMQYLKFVLILPS
jgi:uncharacterized protein YeeX (DUF496 family)